MTRSRWLVFVSALSVMFLSLAAPVLGEPTSKAPSVAPFDYTLSDDVGIRFADEYQRLGGADALGYPASYRFQLPDGFTYQLTQAALLQWRPERDGVLLANTFEMLEKAGIDDWLHAFKSIPRPIRDDGSGGDWQKGKEIRLGWLTNEAIKARYLANPNPNGVGSWSVDASIELYGLPMSRPERFGPFIAQRFQRIAFQLWLDEVPGMPVPGSVVRVLGGDVLKEAGLIPVEALAPGDRPAPTPTSTHVPPTPTAAPPPPPVPTARLAPTGTPTPRPVPTPDPNHPPQQGAFTGYWDSARGPAVSLIEEIASPSLTSEGPFQNLAFSQAWIGRALLVRRLAVSCDEASQGCLGPVPQLFRSYVGELQNRMALVVPQPSRPRLRSYYDADIVAAPSATSEVLSWTVQYGQYFLYWHSGYPYWEHRPYPASVTYSLEIR